MSLGVRKVDRVVIYLPVIPETIIFTLACARGGIHFLVFGGSPPRHQFRVKTPVRRCSSPPTVRTAAARSFP